MIASDVTVHEADSTLTFRRRHAVPGWREALAAHALVALVVMAIGDAGVRFVLGTALMVLASLAMAVVWANTRALRGEASLVIPFRREVVLTSSSSRHYREAVRPETIVIDGTTAPLSSITGVILLCDTADVTLKRSMKTTQVVSATVVLKKGAQLLPPGVQGSLASMRALAEKIAMLVQVAVVTQLRSSTVARPQRRRREPWSRGLAPTPFGPRYVLTVLVLTLATALLGVGSALLPVMGLVPSRAVDTLADRGMWALSLLLWMMGNAALVALWTWLDRPYRVGRLRHHYGLGAPEGGWVTLGMRVKYP